MPRAVAAHAPGLTIGSFRGIALRIDSSWLLIFFLVAWSAASYFPSAIPGQIGPALALACGVLASLVLFASIVLHELSHSLVARALGYEVSSITLFVFGGVSEISGEPRSARDEGAIALAGPICSIVLAAPLRIAAAIAGDGVLHALFGYLAAANFAIAIFNLFPGFPLDGGRVLRAVSRGLGDPLITATRKAAFFGRILGLCFIGLGLATFLLGGWMAGAWMALIGWFLKTSAASSYAQVALRARLEDFTVAEAAERLVPLAPDTTVLAALRRHGLLAGSAERYPVADGGRLLGMVSTERLRSLPREKWGELRVGDFLETGPANAVRPETPLLEAVETMSEAGISEIAVADETSGYLGVLRLDAVARLARETKDQDKILTSRAVAG